VLVLVILEGVVLALLAVLTVGLLRSHAEILRRLHDLGAGVWDDQAEPPLRTQPGVAEPRGTVTPAADLSGVTPSGSTVVVGVVDRPHTTLLAFLSSGCTTCGNFWQAFAAGEADELPGRDTALVVVTKGPEAESPSAIESLAARSVKTVMSSAAWLDYQVPVSPYFVLVDGLTGRIVGEGSGTTWTQVSSLLAQACADAGLTPTAPTAGSGGSGGRRTRRRPVRLAGPAREQRADDELRRAGIGPGHPSLYGQTDPNDAPATPVEPS
jgi:hypothetical protein